MKTIHVNASKSYDVLVGSNLLTQAGSLIRTVSNPSKAAIISDSNVWPLYGAVLTDSLEQAGIPVEHFVFPAGEESKCAETYLAILEFLAQNRLTRSDCVIALGGGVVGDISGFAAATYLRGIDYIQIPTTLLAAVDSSVGGKTAIDLKAGKNLAGAFYQPRLVLCDIDTLTTLPAAIFRDGCAEIIKYGILYDPALFSQLADQILDFDRGAVIARCVELKRDTVAQDEFDRGQRQMLNLGHTIGHGIEALSHFTISHGSAVAIGTAFVCRGAVKQKLLREDDCEKILWVLEQFGLPTTVDYRIQDIFAYTLSDKKRSGNRLNLIVPRAIGTCEIMNIPIDTLKTWIEAGSCL